MQEFWQFKMNISYLFHSELLKKLTQQNSNSLDFVILATGGFDTNDKQSMSLLLQETVRVLKDNGIVFIQGIPKFLPELGVFLEKYLTFKYWLAVKSTPIEISPLPSVHAAVLLFTKGKGRFNINKVRLPHQYCKACNRTLKDWGGKAHLMNPDGYVISDVIKDLPQADNYSQISKPLFDILIEMLDVFYEKKGLQEPSGIVGPLEALPWKNDLAFRHNKQSGLTSFQSSPTLLKTGSDGLPKELQLQAKKHNHKYTGPIDHDISTEKLFNVIHQGDAIEILSQYPDESVDLAFADPPYNLDKDYSIYDDEQAGHKYIEWCNAWLTEYIRILKPNGSLFVLNLPRWALYHASFLNRFLYFQNWIVWDALSEPRGKIMPAHYALLFYTKDPENFTFNYEAVSPVDARHYCLRTSCIRKRKKSGE